MPCNSELAGTQGTLKGFFVPGESSCGQEWVSREVTKREIRKQKASWGRGGMFAWGRAGISFLCRKV